MEGVDVSGASGLGCGHLPALLWSPDTLPDPGGLPDCVPILSVPQPVTNTEGNMLMTSEKPKGLRSPKPHTTGVKPDPVVGIVIFTAKPPTWQMQK